MDPVSAVYYPFMTIRGASFLKAALLLWDRVEIIVPPDSPPVHSLYREPKFAEAAEILLASHTPTAEEQDLAHDRILALATANLPEYFYINSEDPAREWMFGQKLAWKTWADLKSLGLVHRATPSEQYNNLRSASESFLGNSDSDLYAMSAAFGMTAMALIAEVCAGATKRTITDEGTTYTSLVRDTAANDFPAHALDYERLVNITLKVLNVEDLPLRQLVALRKREAAQGGHFLRTMRHTYLRCIDEYVTAIISAKHSEDIAEVDRVFDQTMSDDLRVLREELHLPVDRAIFSKEVIGFVAVLASSFIQPAVAPLLSGIGIRAAFDLLKVSLDVQQSRRKALQDHPISYLFMAGAAQRRPSLFPQLTAC
jgi:hypothetical protein